MLFNGSEGWNWRGGGWREHSQAHPPLDIACVTSSTLRKIHKHPRLDIHKHPPPPQTLDIARVTSSTFQGVGVGVIGPDQDKFRGGSPLSHTPLDPPL